MTVFECVRVFLCERTGCDEEDVTLAATFDELNVADFEREALSLWLEERYETEIPDDQLYGFETVEDLVGYVEDQF